jgi:hypothetical protein
MLRNYDGGMGMPPYGLTRLGVGRQPFADVVCHASQLRWWHGYATLRLNVSRCRSATLCRNKKQNRNKKGHPYIFRNKKGHPYIFSAEERGQNTDFTNISNNCVLTPILYDPDIVFVFGPRYLCRSHVVMSTAKEIVDLDP